MKRWGYLLLLIVLLALIWAVYRVMIELGVVSPISL
jgi:hypothetical protein